MTDAGEDAEKGEPPPQLVGMQAGAATLENSMEVPQEVENKSCPTTQQLHYWAFTLKVQI